MAQQEHTGRVRIWLVILLLVGGAVAGLVVVVATWDRLEQRAQVGDLLGGVIGGAGFLGMIVTLVLQSRELAMQREELADTRRELARQADVAEKQMSVAQSQVDEMVISRQTAELQNSLLERQLSMISCARPSLAWRLADQWTAELVLLNEGPGAAIIDTAQLLIDAGGEGGRATRPVSWESDAVERELGEASKGAFTPTLDPHDLESLEIAPYSTTRLMRVTTSRTGPTPDWSKLSGLCTHITWIPIAGGPNRVLPQPLAVSLEAQ